MTKIVFHPLMPLVLLSVLQTVFMVGTMQMNSVMPGEAEATLSFGWSALLACWIEADARRRRQTPCFDFGFLCCLCLPLATIWYCLRTRGWKGVLLLFGLTVIWIAPYGIAMTLWLIWFGMV
ncbi:MAG TPA: hypothetical protein VFG20_14725 [Planctomycetaceae bacterium]|nr:hypothetical protein [Planctomycetaceae bacterium]